MYRAQLFRLYPTPAQEAALGHQLATLRNVYNAAIAWWRDAYAYEKAGRGQMIPMKAKKSGDGERKFGLMETLYPIISGIRNLHVQAQKDGEPGPHWLAQVSAVSVRDTIKRVQKAFDHFYRRCKQGAKKKGYPRFKAHGRLRSIPFDNYGNGCKLDGDRLYVFGVGRVKVRCHRAMEGTIQAVYVRRDVDGKWHVVMMCQQDEKTVEPKQGPAVGVDVGLEHFLTTSDGEHEPNPKFLKLTLPKLRRLQRTASRRMEQAKKQKRKFRESKNLQKAFRAVAQAHVRVRNQRKEHHHKVSRRLVDRYATVCVESLTVSNMVRNGKLSRAIGDAGWSGFVTTLKQHAAKAGVSVVEVDPRGTSQECPNCGGEVRKKLQERAHRCDSCGYSTHRDHAAAQVILARGTNGVGRPPVRHNVGPLPEGKPAGKVKRAGRSVPPHSSVMPTGGHDGTMGRDVSHEHREKP